jgi:hypothetical protein
MVGKENQMHRYATVGRGSQDYKEQIPGDVVHAHVDQKLLKSNEIKSFN